jgi:protein phosphatase
MKIVIISDPHGNIAALDALPEHDYDQLWCIGDLVNYGPRPREVINWIRAKAAGMRPGQSRSCRGARNRSAVLAGVQATGRRNDEIYGASLH